MRATQGSTALGKQDRSQQFAALRYVSRHLESGMDVGRETEPTPERTMPHRPPAVGREIEQILLHMVQDAAEATPEGGRIVVSVYGEREAIDALTRDTDVRRGELGRCVVLAVERQELAGDSSEPIAMELRTEPRQPGSAIEGVVLRRQRKFLIEGAAGWIAC